MNTDFQDIKSYKKTKYLWKSVKICVLIYLDEDLEILKNDHKDKTKKSGNIEIGDSVLPPCDYSKTINPRVGCPQEYPTNLKIHSC